MVRSFVSFPDICLTDAGSRRQPNTYHAQIAQLVEQRTENPRVTGSIPVLGIFSYSECGERSASREKFLFQAEFSEEYGNPEGWSTSSVGRALDF